jgi:DNA-binding NtrC family response regulator
MSKLFATLLARCSFLAATNARQLLGVSRHWLGSGERFDLVITDLLNTPLDGFSLLLRLKKSFPDIPVVMASAVHDVSVGTRCIREGAHDYLMEPFERAELMRVVRRALEHRSLKLFKDASVEIKGGGPD